MYPYMNEDVAWERLKDIQREMENRRLMAEAGQSELVYLGQLLVERARGLVRALRSRRPLQVPVAVECEGAASTDAA